MSKNSTSPKEEDQLSFAAPNFPKLEEDVLRFWEQRQIFSKTLEKTAAGVPFVFFEGPPTANGKPGIHHVLARVFKDVIIRFQTMRGRFVARKAGWDTHGLPVELQVEKSLGISGKKQIENIVAGDRRASIAEFNSRCKESVTAYIDDWQKLTRRIGFWLDMDNAYRTYANPYMETLWWTIKQIASRKTSEGDMLYLGHKVVPHCPRCETALSSHEVAQGYKRITENSAYIRFKVTNPENIGLKGDVYMLSWTTTPWTLPGNVALAVAPKLAYVVFEQKGKKYILAKNRIEAVCGDGKILKEFSGSELADLGLSYQPLFPGAVKKGKASHAWEVFPATFVTGEDGTGIVHTAVMYGEDDYQLGVQVGLPKYHTVDQTGHFTPDVKKWQGKFVKDKKVEEEIVADLKERGLLYKEEMYTHDYPFCWRCGTPLLYYAKNSWFIRMSALRKELLSANKTIAWVPSYIKDGRFGEWLKEVKDWAFSRERYWGTPLPIWVCQSCGRKEVIGSFNELKKKAIKETLPEAQRGAYLMRHGETLGNIKHTNHSIIEKDDMDLTEAGVKQIESTAAKLKGKIDLIVCSDFLRTRHTAEIIAKATGARMLTDRRLRETYYPTYEGLPDVAIKKDFPGIATHIYDAPSGCESLWSAGQRVTESVVDNLQRFSRERILFISHGDPLLAFFWMQSGKPPKEIDKVPYPKIGSFKQVEIRNLPINPHRPYIDDIHLRCTCKDKGIMKRVEEVADVWFDSGAMPFSQAHYPFEKEKDFAGSFFPADYISEAIDQTRGWFYTLLAVSTLLEKNAPYKHVICLGHIVDEKGEKMSKSKGNIVDPWAVINETGADALRLHLFSVNQPGDVKIFSLDGVRDVLRKTLMILWNVESFYLQHGSTKSAGKGTPECAQELDRWIMSLLAQTIATVTKELEAFHVFEASRKLRDFVTDLSTWYLRRSRERIKDPQSEASAVLQHVIGQISILFAPFCPFFAESIFQRLPHVKSKGSVHLMDWPKPCKSDDEKLMIQMLRVREIVELALAIRKEKNIKIRQPLAAFSVNQKLETWQVKLICEELNVVTIDGVSKAYPEDRWVEKSRGSLKVRIDTRITDDLREQGNLREFMRHINDIRKLARFGPRDMADIFIETDKTMQDFFKSHMPGITTGLHIRHIAFNMDPDVLVKKTVKVDGHTITLGTKPAS